MNVVTTNDGNDIANKFYSFYVNVGTVLTKSMSRTDKNLNNYMRQDMIRNLSFYPVTEQEYVKSLVHLKIVLLDGTIVKHDTTHKIVYNYSSCTYMWSIIWGWHFFKWIEDSRENIFVEYLKVLYRVPYCSYCISMIWQVFQNFVFPHCLLITRICLSLANIWMHYVTSFMKIWEICRNGYSVINYLQMFSKLIIWFSHPEINCLTILK